MIKASVIADAICAIDTAIRFIHETEYGIPHREDTRAQLHKSRVELEAVLKQITVEVKP